MVLSYTMMEPESASGAGCPPVCRWLDSAAGRGRLRAAKPTWDKFPQNFSRSALFRKKLIWLLVHGRRSG
jgi:hypothetical protein